MSGFGKRQNTNKEHAIEVMDITVFPTTVISFGIVISGPLNTEGYGQTISMSTGHHLGKHDKPHSYRPKCEDPSYSSSNSIFHQPRVLS